MAVSYSGKTEYAENPYFESGRSGASSLARIRGETQELDARNLAERHQAMREQHEAEMEAYRRAEERIMQAREERKFQHDMLQAKHAEDMERETTAALKKISAIDMTKPEALTQLQKVQGEHPEAFVGPGSIASTYKDLWDRATAHQNAREMAAERVQAAKDAAAEKAQVKKDADAEKSKSKTEANIGKTRDAFEKSYSNYREMERTLASSDNPTDHLRGQRNLDRAEMVRLGNKLKGADPEASAEVDSQIKGAVKVEHDALVNDMQSLPENDPKRVKEISRLNDLKEILGMKPVNAMGHDADHQGGSTASPSKSATASAPTDNSTPPAQPKTEAKSPKESPVEDVPQEITSDQTPSVASTTPAASTSLVPVVDANAPAASTESTATLKQPVPAPVVLPQAPSTSVPLTLDQSQAQGDRIARARAKALAQMNQSSEATKNAGLFDVANPFGDFHNQNELESAAGERYNKLLDQGTANAEQSQKIAEGPAGTQPAAATPTQASAPTEEPGPDITPEAHASLKPGDKFWWKGKQLTKQ